MTRAEFLRHARQPGKIPDLTMPSRCAGLIQYFYAIRNLTGIIDNPLTMAVIKDWQEHTYVELERWERECIFAMDRAFRRSYSDVLKYHAERDAAKRNAAEKRKRK